MSLNADVLMLRSGELWDSEVIDISATGVLIKRPVNWEGELGEQLGLELLLGEFDTIGVFATISRIDDDTIAFQYSRIPVRSEAPLWNLLGVHADTMEVPKAAS